MTVIAVLYVNTYDKAMQIQLYFWILNLRYGPDCEKFSVTIHFSPTLCFTLPLYLLVDNGSSLGRVRRPTGGDMYQTKEGG